MTFEPPPGEGPGGAGAGAPVAIFVIKRSHLATKTTNGITNGRRGPSVHAAGRALAHSVRLTHLNLPRGVIS